ncbi:E3 ubiquitin-protein ligase Topors isoform X2 [Tripterygium wilfordii]|uniref:RING-type E3 ubiquitin transferase n=1 Tax=Tripterygium wilfordii TaxID=458696 RepID=A0A7J7CS71_TRIWF|nr:uncharacterized protein LOC120014859 [Tripterygium wilfordii]KAF5736957.1 E3 ubiquitin-protein ligase Topors isoform X2 [Tripterygium wilfordii]
MVYMAKSPFLSLSPRSLQMGRRETPRDNNGEKIMFRVIKAAIEGQSCSICLKELCDRRAAVLTICKHAYCLDCICSWSNLKRTCPLCNAEFDSWFYNISFSCRKFLKKQLPALRDGKDSIATEDNVSPVDWRRIIRRSRDGLNRVDRGTRPLPWRRSFGAQSGSVPSEVIAERKLQWRASVYSRRLEAVPLSPQSCSKQDLSRKKELIMQRMDPWIRRELQAILSDPDPSVIVHVASSLFIVSLEKKSEVPSVHLGVEDNFLAPLQPFLQDYTAMFWHELRCFCESSFPMKTYDAVVEYRKLD